MQNNISTYPECCTGFTSIFTASPASFTGNSFFISFTPYNVYICTGTSMVLALSACFSDTLPATEETEESSMIAIAVNANETFLFTILHQATYSNIPFHSML
jgi:hypothetical protein